MLEAGLRSLVYSEEEIKDIVEYIYAKKTAGSSMKNRCSHPNRAHPYLIRQIGAAAANIISITWVTSKWWQP